MALKVSNTKTSGFSHFESIRKFSLENLLKPFFKEVDFRLRLSKCCLRSKKSENDLDYIVVSLAIKILDTLTLTVFFSKTLLLKLF